MTTPLDHGPHRRLHMTDLTDAELPGYFTLHCRTEVAAFHKNHVIRLLRLAGMNEEADVVDKHPKQFWHFGPDVIDPIVERIT